MDLKHKSVKEKLEMIDKSHPKLSIKRQADILDLNRSNIYYVKKIKEDEEKYLNLIKEIHSEKIFFGVRKITKELQNKGHLINKKRVARIMRENGIKAIHPKPNTSIPRNEDKKYPYLLKDLDFKKLKNNQIWSTDITYIKIQGGFIYLVAIIDWNSRFVLSWELSNSLDAEFCKRTLEKALILNKNKFKKQNPEIFNTDQGSQFTSNDFTEILKNNKIKISMDGKGRCLDNIFIERLWRTVKYEEIYLKEYNSIQELYDGLKKYFNFYNYERIHESLNYKTPAEVYLN